MHCTRTAAATACRRCAKAAAWPTSRSSSACRRHVGHQMRSGAMMDAVKGDDPTASPVRFERDGDVAILTLANPARLNPLGLLLQRGLRALLAEVRADRGIRALVLTGDGKGFCVGADLSAMGPGADGDARSVGERTADIMQTLSNRLVLDLRELP